MLITEINKRRVLKNSLFLNNYFNKTLTFEILFLKSIYYIFVLVLYFKNSLTKEHHNKFTKSFLNKKTLLRLFYKNFFNIILTFKNIVLLNKGCIFVV